MLKSSFLHQITTCVLLLMAALPAAAEPPVTASRPARSQVDHHPFAPGGREKVYAEIVGESFKKRYTDHFVVLYDADEPVVKDFILRIERTYDSVQHFAEKMDIKIEFPKEKLPIIFCGSYETFVEKFGKLYGGHSPPAEAAGLYLPDPVNVSIFFDMSQNKYMKEAAEKARQAHEAVRNSSDANTKREKLREAQWYENSSLVYQQTYNRSVVQHEVTHQLLYNFVVHNRKSPWQNPQWLVEGLATIFEPPPGKDGAGFGVINQMRLGDIREPMQKTTVEELRAFIAKPSPNHQMLPREGYARAWAISCFLVKRRAKQLPGYLQVIKKRTGPAEISPEAQLADFEKAFGTVNDSFLKELKEFIEKLPFKPEHPTAAQTQRKAKR